jgi:hypothetical protein
MQLPKPVSYRTAISSLMSLTQYHGPPAFGPHHEAEDFWQQLHVVIYSSYLQRRNLEPALGTSLHRLTAPPTGYERERIKVLCHDLALELEYLSLSRGRQNRPNVYPNRCEEYNSNARGRFHRLIHCLPQDFMYLDTVAWGS